MFTHVMNLTMNAAIFRAGAPSGMPEPAATKKTKAARRRSEPAARKWDGSRVPATVRIYADAFKTAVYGG
ncbi:MAG TPA: hypothetical protein VLS27_11085 [Gammaproteobacteria bacterium]|nr:hypothetical protein [Gammaproteobacteria bacterium]